MGKLAIIGGTGVYDPSIVGQVEEKQIETPYGTAQYMIGTKEGTELIFMMRHGAGHSIPPHLINYRANIWALKKLGVTHIVSTTAVASIKEEFGLGHFVLADQFLDFTKVREHTFYTGGDRGVAHVDVTEPYCPYLRGVIEEEGKKLELPIHNGGVYVCTEGPRFETPAEIRMFAQLGGHLVGMTNVPEVTLAAEAEMCYSTISLITNFGAGMSPTPLTHHEVLDIMNQQKEALQKLLGALIPKIDVEKDCYCHHRLEEYGGFTL